MERLTAAYAALARGDPAETLRLLDGWKSDLPALAARGSAYRAQALRDAGRTVDADRELTHAIQLAKKCGDVEGVATLRRLRAPITASLAALVMADQERKKDLYLLDTSNDTLDADGLIRKANALTDAGRPEATGVAALARERASEPRHTVLSYLAEARCTPDHAAELIRAAHAVADDAGDHNLITAVAQAARAARVTLDTPTFG